MIKRHFWATSCAALRAVRGYAVGGLAVFAACTLPLSTAQARGASRGASIVVDANTGEVLHASNADAHRYPASITKVMTLYMLFEQLDARKMTMDTPLRVSRRAASQPPSRLGVEAGSSIRVQDAIMSLVTRSANDVAAVIAENMAGSVENFADRMTRKAKALGMTRTVFKNASGLPDPEQYTTARDLATLGRAMYERFPHYSRMFSRRSFDYEGESIRNHNKLLGRITGVDGIKTGYTRASGFNLLTSARYEGRHVVAVVLGGNTGRERDALMTRLVQRYLPQSSAMKKPDLQLLAHIRAANGMESGAAPVMVASREEAPRPVPVVIAPIAVATKAPTNLAPMPAPRPVAAAPVPQARPTAPAVATIQPTKPILRPIPGARMVASVAPIPNMRWQTGPQPVRMSDADDGLTTQSIEKADVPLVAEAPAAAAIPPAEAAPAPSVSAPSVPTPVAPTAKTAARLEGWAVQIAAASSEAEAKTMLENGRTYLKGRHASAQPVTEKVSRGGSTFYRARFAGFDSSNDASAACSALKRGDFKCMPIRL